MTSREPLVLLQDRAAGVPPPSMTLADQLRVSFSGQRGGEGPLTLGQISTLGWVSDETFYTRMIEWPLTLPAGATLDGIVAALQILMVRHESLRTIYPPTAGQPVQRVAESGELIIDVYAAGGEPANTAVLVMELARRLRSAEFDVTTELPLRAAVATWQGVPRAVVVVYSHMAVDFASMALIDRQFAQLVSDPAHRVAGPLGHQPLDQAAEERSPRGLRRAGAALRSWEAHLRTMPQFMFAMPSADPRHSGGLESGWLWSPAAALALPHVAARTGASGQLAVFAAVCVLLGQRTGHEQCMMLAPASNRYQRHMREYVGTLAQDCIMSIDVQADGLDAVVRRAAAAALRSNRNGLVEIAALDRVITTVESDRGMTYARYCAFNDLSVYLDDPQAHATRPGPAEARRALHRTRFSFFPSPAIEELLLFMLHQVEGEMILGAVTSDANRMPRAEMEALLRGVELLLVEAATSDVDLSLVGEITGIHPVTRGPSWLKIGPTWVDLAEVQRLLADALPTPADVFALPGPDGNPSLVAYLAATPAIQTPEQAHHQCMSVLAGNRSLTPPHGIRYTALAPTHYVICQTAPPLPRTLPAWQHQPIQAEGPGRSHPAPPSPDIPFERKSGRPAASP
ncbi:MAG TPA: condensation domain-containing protein [Streptosporangiaceae bacterium]